MSVFLKRLKARKASLLVEVLLAVVILSVSITVIIQSMTSSARAMNFSSDYAAAAVLLENKMQEHILTGFIPLSTEEGTFEDFGGKYRYSVKAMDPDDQDSKIKIIEVIVLWDAGKKEKSVGLQSYLFKEE